MTMWKYIRKAGPSRMRSRIEVKWGASSDKSVMFILPKTLIRRRRNSKTLTLKLL
jgi:hypothetical protein